MDSSTVNLNGKTFVLKFGMKVFRLLGEKLNTPTLLTTQQKVISVLGGMTDDMSFEQLKIINSLILSAIEANPENVETITEDELDDLYFTNTKEILDVMTIVMNDFAKSLPQPDKGGRVGKPKAQTKKVSRKTTKK